MKPYGQFCPVAKACEILGERWSMLVVREVMSGSARFNEIERGIPGIPRAILSQRLRTLEDHGILMRREVDGKSHYALTLTGRELEPVVMALGEWGQRWLNRDLREDELDLRLLMWDVHRRINTDRLPAGRTVVQFDFTGAQTAICWLVLTKEDVEVCDVYPGFEVDLFVKADTLAIHRVWMGRLTLADAMRRELIELDGPSALTAQFPSWLALNVFAGVAPAPARAVAKAAS